MLRIGIVGLPNVGKSTIFQALTKKQVNIDNYPFVTIDPNVGVVSVPDERLQKLSKLVPGAAVLPAVIEIVDVAGLVKGAHRGEGLGNQFLSHLSPMDALLFLNSSFRHPDIVSLADDPGEQLAILREELKKKDAELLERAKKEKSFSSPPALSAKPQIIVCNIKSSGENFDFELCQNRVDGKLELELSEMDEYERKELGIDSQLPALIGLAYRTLGLITFYTLKGGKELRAWPIKTGTVALQAAGIVHTDFEKKFIRAEVIDWAKLVEAGSWISAREKGWIRTEGKEYIVQDGDVIEFKI